MCHKYYPKNHPQKSDQELNTDHSCRNRCPTGTTFACLYTIGKERYEFIPLEFFSTGETLTTSSPKGSLYLLFHHHSTKTSYACSEKQKTKSVSIEGHSGETKDLSSFKNLSFLERELLFYECPIFGHEVTDDSERKECNPDSDGNSGDNE